MGRATASQFYYAAHGAVGKVMLGNGLWEHTTFNARLQPTEIGIGLSAVSGGTWQVKYGYGTTDNNGNVQSQAISGAGLALFQSYTYDALNRLAVAAEMKAGVEQWRQSYSYDRYGNQRLNWSATSANVRPQTSAEVPTISTATNRITSTGYSFDGAGNMTGEPSHTYQYDAENRLVTFDAGSEHAATYRYDGEGRRVKKVTGGAGSLAVATTFVYDAGGKLIAEYGTNTVGQVGAETSYLTQDTLGSTRVVTNGVIAKGATGVKARSDYLPFGEEIASSYGGRYGVGGYANAVDNIRQKFAKYERDGETGLDYAQARYFSSVQGRFTSPDPIYLAHVKNQCLM